MKTFTNFIFDLNFQVSAINVGIWMSALDWVTKIVFGLPSAIYICLKIYSEFIKPSQKENPNPDSKQ